MRYTKKTIDPLDDTNFSPSAQIWLGDYGHFDGKSGAWIQRGNIADAQFVKPAGVLPCLCEDRSITDHCDVWTSNGANAHFLGCVDSKIASGCTSDLLPSCRIVFGGQDSAVLLTYKTSIISLEAKPMVIEQILDVLSKGSGTSDVALVTAITTSSSYAIIKGGYIDQSVVVYPEHSKTLPTSRDCGHRAVEWRCKGKVDYFRSYPETGKDYVIRVEFSLFTPVKPWWHLSQYEVFRRVYDALILFTSFPWTVVSPRTKLGVDDPSRGDTSSAKHTLYDTLITTPSFKRHNRDDKLFREVCRVLDGVLRTSFSIDNAVSRLGDITKHNQVLDIVQTLVDENREDTLKQVLFRLTKETNKLPNSLFLRNVTCDEVSIPQSCGSCADVFIGQCEKQKVALKRLRAYQIVTLSEKENLKEIFDQKALVWRNLHHQYILPFLGVDSSIFKRSLCMVSPWMELCSIRDVISKMIDNDVDADIWPKQCVVWCAEAAHGLEYLHNENVVHGDLRGANVLIDDENHVRICDFGLSVFTEVAAREFNSAQSGNEAWLAPEVMHPELFGLRPTQPTYAGDIYSYGCLCYEIFTGNDPFVGVPKVKLLLEVPKGRRPLRPRTLDSLQMTDSVWDLLEMCWQQRPEDRPGIQDIVKFTTSYSLKQSG